MWNFIQDHWRDGVEILILAVLLYHGYRFLRATRGARILTGLLVLLLGLTLISQLLELQVMNWLLERFSVFLAVGLVVLFQPELRRVLAELGSHRFFSFNATEEASVDQLIEAMVSLSHKRCGALFALQRGIELKPYAESGVGMDARMSLELVGTIFHPKTPLHDGGMIVDQGRIIAAGCVFPVTQKDLNDRSVGLRHRAGIGISEETDAIALVVSEETGALSLCYKGKLEHDLEANELRTRLQQILMFGDDDEEETKPGKQEGVTIADVKATFARVKLWFTRDWEAKLVSLVLAFLLWYVIHDQISRGQRFMFEMGSATPGSVKV
ncbi:diadenylate cyclase CdaA [Verrucomicrobium spinosum]|uniref:diadenylate cyclase CdaA n=1 Tax=Verrucomicrobium spinosum TaxID=2736 RepID=UPI0001745B9C|nr:diadenylate cyclase CdaA [Verrucomicrobium spinosum]